MTDLASYLERLGLEQYLDAFVGEGFDTLETLLDIQESDFDALNVKLGHRRKLQRAIADARGIPFERLVAVSSYEGLPEVDRGGNGGPVSSAASASGGTAGTETKRKYRRHPKPDDNAPERPPSAYVIFSNKVREEVKDQNLTFTQIAKLVGERWQKLDQEGKEPFEANANAAKERYNIQLSTYKKTDAYKEYMQYLADFKAKHGGSSEQKRPRLDPESSGGSISAKSQELQPELLYPGQGGHVRGESIGSMGSTTYAPVVTPPGIPPAPSLSTQHPQLATAYLRKGSMDMSQGNSPPSVQPGHEVRRPGQVSNQSSISEGSSVMRSESDALAQVSLNTPPSATPPLPPLPPQPGSQWEGLKGPGPVMGMGQSFGSAFGQILPSPPTTENIWRGRPLDLRGYPEPARAMQPPSMFTCGPPSSSISLPPLIGSDRFSDPQRTLPLPRSSPKTQQAPGGPRFTESPRPHPFGPAHKPQPSQGGLHSPLDRSESDAANALAGLSASGPRSDSAKLPDSKWPNR